MAFMLVFSPLRAMSPSALLSGTWALVYLLQFVFASDMNCTLLQVAAVCAITLSFTVGELIGCGGMHRVGKSILDCANPAEVPPQERVENIRALRLITIFLIVLGFIGVAGYAKAIGVLTSQGAEDLLSAPGIARAAINSGELAVPMSSRIGVLIAYPSVILALTYYYLERWRWWLVLPIINVALFGASQAGRAGTMMTLVQLALAMYLKSYIVYRRSMLKSSLSGMSVPGVMILAVFLGGALLREGFGSVDFDDISRIIYSARGYLFGGLSAFSYWINNMYDPSSVSLGKYSFSSLYSALGLIPPDSGIYQFYAPLSHAGDVSNVFSAYRSFIEDFSVPGACLIYFGAGMWIATIGRYVCRGRRVWILVLIPMLSWLALSPMFSATYFDSFLLSCLLPFILVRHVCEVREWKRSSLYVLISTMLLIPGSYWNRSAARKGS